MKLNDILKGVAHEVIEGSGNTEVKKITSDSREVEAGTYYFIALRGYDYRWAHLYTPSYKKGPWLYYARNTRKAQ